MFQSVFASYCIMTDKVLSAEFAVFGVIYMEEYLQISDVIDWQHPAIMAHAKQMALGCENSMAIAKACFEWVRDEIHHSVDYQINPVTCCASEVFQHKTGYCYAKSHLLAALLRANQIPTGFCYQRLRTEEQGAQYSLHGFNAIYLPEMGWYRVDARGNREGVDAQFLPPQERLAFEIQLPEEVDFRAILPEPLKLVVEALQSQTTWDEMLRHLPDISAEVAKNYGLATYNVCRPAS
jgi:transglutaminase-like putative cysteine protease